MQSIGDTCPKCGTYSFGGYDCKNCKKNPPKNYNIGEAKKDWEVGDWSLVKPGHNPTYSNGKGFLKVFKNQEAAEGAFAIWQEAALVHQIPVPDYQLIKKPDSIEHKGSYAVYTSRALGTFCQLSKTGTRTNFIKLFMTASKTTREAMLDALLLAAKAGLGDCQFFYNLDDPMTPIRFIDINLKKGAGQNIITLIEELQYLISEEEKLKK